MFCVAYSFNLITVCHFIILSRKHSSSFLHYYNLYDSTLRYLNYIYMYIYCNFRYVNIGILILFCHDITDIVLEGTKLILYCREKGGKWHSVCDFLSTIGFLLFGLTW